MVSSNRGLPSAFMTGGTPAAAGEAKRSDARSLSSRARTVQRNTAPLKPRGLDTSSPQDCVDKNLLMERQRMQSTIFHINCLPRAFEVEKQRLHPELLSRINIPPRNQLPTLNKSSFNHRAAKQEHDAMLNTLNLM
eukprot:103981-Amphidinium_carterae.1